MVNIFLPEETAHIPKRYVLFFTGTISLTLVAFISSFFLFPLESGLISVFFASFTLIPSIENILEKNKNDIWQKRMTPIKANLDMATSLVIIFMAVLTTYCFIIFAVPTDTIEKIFFSQVHDTMTHTHLITKSFYGILDKRLSVCIIFFFVSLIFRVGSIFVLVWIASIWGVIYGVFFSQGFALSLPVIKHYEIVLGVSGVGSMIIRTLSFITASMAGMFLSKALAKYNFKSKEFKQVFKAVLEILIVSILLLLASVYWEYTIYN